MTGTFLRDDGTFAAPPSGGGGTPGGSSGQVQVNSGGTFAGETNAQLTARIAQFNTATSGAVPVSPGGSTAFLRADGAFAIPTGTGGGGAGFDLINVMDYGAVGDGVADDTVAIQAAIDFMMTQSGNHRIRTIYLPEGNYKITKPIYIDHPWNLRGLTEATWNSGYQFSQHEVTKSGGIRYISIQNFNQNHLTSDTAWWIPFDWDVSRAYTVGQKVLFDNIPWKCMVANTGQTPVLPPKMFDGAPGYAVGEKIEYRNRIYTSIQAGAQGYRVMWENASTSMAGWWTESPTYWLPDSVYPVIFYMSPIFTGVGDDSGQTGWGTFIRPTFNTCCIIHMTPGQGPEIANIQLICPQSPTGFSTFAGQPPGGIGIGLHGGNGGSSRTLVRNCVVFHCYVGVQTGTVDDALCDSNVIYRTNVWNCARGFVISKTQNFINTISECSAGALISVFAAVGTGCHVYGGNFSPNGIASKKIPMSSISALTYTGGSAGRLDFTATLVPDVNLIAGRYNRCTIKTAHFGVIPVSISSFNETTNIASLSINNQWTCNFLRGAFEDPTTYTDIQAEVQACLTLYCCEGAIIFLGEGFHVIGTHIEAAQTPMCLILADSGFGSGPKSVLELLQFNSDISMAGDFAANDDDNHPKYLAAMAYPFIQIVSRDVEIRNSMLGCYNQPVPVWNFGQSARLTLFNNKWAQFIFCGVQNPSFADVNGGSIWHGVFGGSESDGPPQRYAQQSMNNFAGQKRAGGIASSPHWGVRPAGYTVPTIDADTVSKMRMNSQAPDGDGGARYPLIWGGHPYQVHGDVNNAQWDTNTLIKSNHFFYTYGYDLTNTLVPGLSWSFKGASFCVYVADPVNDMRHIFPGLGVILNDILYIVTGTYESLGYFTVVRFTSPNQWGLLAGATTTIYTGNLIKQQLFDIRTLPEKYTFLPPPCDQFTPAAAYSFRKLRTAYAGSAVRIRRSSDNVEADIGFDPGGDFDTQAYLAHVGASSGFVRTWYDQSVNANHLQQATSANQPLFVLNGFNQRPLIQCFNANAQKMTATVTGPATTATAMTVEAVVQAAGILLTGDNASYAGSFTGTEVSRITSNSYGLQLRVDWSGVGNGSAQPKVFGSMAQIASYQDTTTRVASAFNGVSAGEGTASPRPCAINSIKVGGIADEFEGRLMELILVPQYLHLRDRGLWQNQMTYFGV